MRFQAACLIRLETGKVAFRNGPPKEVPDGTLDLLDALGPEPVLQAQRDLRRLAAPDEDLHSPNGCLLANVAGCHCVTYHDGRLLKAPFVTMTQARCISMATVKMAPASSRAAKV